MSSRLVLIDSSIWVSHLSRRPSSHSSVIGHLLESHRVATNDVIRLEVLTGALDEAHYAELADVFQGLHLLPVSGPVWQLAARLRYELRRQGHLPPVSDMLISASALVHECELLHADRHFDIIARIAPLKFYSPSHR